MPKVKIPRKSTNIDMTAMCDVAFLLLSFFILATKQKPPEALAVTPPNSISAKAVPDKSILITFDKDGKAFLMLGDKTKKAEILEDVNKSKGLNLSAAEMAKWNKQEFYGMPFNMVKGALAISQEVPPSKMPGIPLDSALDKNELKDWLKSVTNTYAGSDQSKLQEMLLVKGDLNSVYPVFKNVKAAFKANELYKFRIVTNGEAVPIGSELYNESQKN